MTAMIFFFFSRPKTWCRDSLLTLLSCRNPLRMARYSNSAAQFHNDYDYRNRKKLLASKIRKQRASCSSAGLCAATAPFPLGRGLDYRAAAAAGAASVTVVTVIGELQQFLLLNN